MKRIIPYILTLLAFGPLTARALEPADSIATSGTVLTEREERISVSATDSVAEAVMDSVAVPASLPARPKPKSTPVDYDREKPPVPSLHYYDKHGEALETPVRFLAELDTVTKVKSGPTFPAYNGVSVGLNFFDGIMLLAGQRRASFDLWAECSVFNWIFPVVEAGLGVSNARPDDGRFHFKVKPSPYVNVGLNYNFLYKSNPAYQFFIGLRAGWSSFGYDILNINPGSEYYVEDGPRNVRGLKSTAFYGQALAGVKVKIWNFISMGWSFRYAFNLHQTYSDPDYPAWFTPGKNRGGIGATFSLIFDIHKPKTDPVEKDAQ